MSFSEKVSAVNFFICPRNIFFARTNFFILSLIFFILSLNFLCSCSEGKIYSRVEGEVFHTYYHIQYDLRENYAQGIDSTFQDFSLSLNPFEPKSLLSAINRNETALTDDHFRYVWQMVGQINEVSNGSYDPTISPLINAWGFGFKPMVEDLTEVKIDSLLSFVGYDKLKLRGDTLIKDDSRTIIDLSSISKGYCSDLVGKYLEREGAKNYMVEIGGEIAFRGLNARGEPWMIGINKPIEDSTGLINEFQLIVSLDREQGGLATSGNYRNYKIQNGQKRVHTINPKTGHPIQTDVLSATILANSCMEADGLATACMTMTSGEAVKMLSKLDNIEYLLIVGKEGKFSTIESKGFKQMIKND